MDMPLLVSFPTNLWLSSILLLPPLQFGAVLRFVEIRITNMVKAVRRDKQRYAAVTSTKKVIHSGSDGVVFDQLSS